MTQSDETAVYIGLGSNLGNRETHLARATELIVSRRGIRLCAASPVYLTQPQHDPEQPWFANQVIKTACTSAWSPIDLLDVLLDTEHQLGRIRNPERRFGPRIIDCDLLIFGDVVMSHPRLTVPHPRLGSRAFMLVPLMDIDPLVEVAPGVSAAAALERLSCVVQGRRIWQNA